MRFGRTDLIVGVSKANKCKESAGGIHFSVAPQKFNKNNKKHCVFCNFRVFRFCRFFDRQASYRAETFTIRRSQAPRHVSCMFAARVSRNRETFAKMFAKNFAGNLLTQAPPAFRNGRGNLKSWPGSELLGGNCLNQVAVDPDGFHQIRKTNHPLFLATTIYSPESTSPGSCQ